MDLSGFLSNLRNKSILVIGDLMLDEFVKGEASRMSPEAPVPVLDVASTSMFPGGAANTACNVKNFGAKVYLMGVLGEDSDATALRKLLEKQGINIEGVYPDPSRPTTIKTRVMSGSHHIVRIDQESREEIGDDLSKMILDKVKALMPAIDAVIISDYSKGVITPALLEKLIPLAREASKPVVVDPKIKDYASYRGVTILTPSKEEIGRAMGVRLINETSLRNAALKTLTQLECDAVLVNLEKEGMCLFERGGELSRFPKPEGETYNPMGVRDIIVTVLTLALTSGASMKDACRLAKSAADIVSARTGSSAITVEEIKDRLNMAA